MSEGKGGFARCRNESDILVVESQEEAERIGCHIKNPCHNHPIVVRAGYEKCVEERLKEFRERAAVLCADAWNNASVTVNQKWQVQRLAELIRALDISGEENP